MKLFTFLASLALFFAAPPVGRAARLEVVDVPGATLKDNPLGDPPGRELAVISPNGTGKTASLGLVIYLPGWGGSSEEVIAANGGGWLGGVVDRLAAGKKPLRIAVVDGRSRYGGSQFLNSSATGRYADYVTEEIVPLLLQRYRTEEGQVLLAGHSSGAYGALILTSAKKAKFNGVVALSPDSNFEVTHKPLVQAEGVRRLTAAEVAAAMAPAGKYRLPGDGLATLVLGLCANYTGIAAQPGKFEWLYDASGGWRQDVWNGWIDQDPLTLVQRHADAYSREQRIYLDGAKYDEFGANIGARKIYNVLRERDQPVEFYEAPGHHSDDLSGRLVRGLDWGLGK